jgi:hypothetical protein
MIVTAMRCGQSNPIHSLRPFTDSTSRQVSWCLASRLHVPTTRRPQRTVNRGLPLFSGTTPALDVHTPAHADRLPIDTN